MTDLWYSQGTVMLVASAITVFFLIARLPAVVLARRETTITPVMVCFMVGLASVFFLVAEQVTRLVVTFLLGIGS